MGYTLMCMCSLHSLQSLALILVEEHSYALSWLHRKALTHFPPVPKQEWQPFSDTALCRFSAECS